jgi:hypothetical protein
MVAIRRDRESYYFNNYLKGQTLTLEEGEPKSLAPSHFLDAQVIGTGRQRGATCFCFPL